ncbi:hypothetical protein BGZ83_001598 [Gryganskiella cystojenkinii]|nr:hypothetical protein BGZ83_001598 [Gryganskiella cystojenkinii]
MINDGSTGSLLSNFIPDTLSSSLLASSQSIDSGINSYSNNNSSEIRRTTNPSSLVVTYVLQLVHFLQSRGLKNCETIPGCPTVLSWKEPVLEFLQPVIRFVATHRALTFIMAVLHLWLAAEVVFCVMFWKKLARLQEVDRVVKGVGSKAKRTELFQRCLETVGHGEEVKRWIEVWFDTGRTSQPAKFEDIGRSNMIHWLAWAFWAAPVEEVFESPSAVMELNQMVDTIEVAKNIKFTEGHNPDVDCIRLSLDPVIASHRPLIYYLLVWIANVLASVVLSAFGFTRYESTLSKTHEFEPRIPSTKKHRRSSSHGSPRHSLDGATAPSNRTPVDLAYWYRTPVNPENPVPLVFIHGIGVGIVQYIHLIVALTFISRPLILVDVPYVSNKLIETDCMTPDETYFAIERILKTHSHPKATFFGHSLGTMLCAAVCRASPASSPTSIVAGLILADPICFLTHHSIARNFAYRIPATASQLVMDLFAAREIGTSWYIMRRFCWNQCVMFPIAWSKRNQKPLKLQGKLSPVLPKKTRVFLSRNDNLLDMTKIEAYLKDLVGLDPEREDELVVMEEMDHAQFLLRPDWFRRVLKAAREC